MITSWLLISLVVAWAVAVFVVMLAACGTSFDAEFQYSEISKEKCINILATYLTLAISDVIVDLAMLVIPIPAVQ